MLNRGTCRPAELRNLRSTLSECDQKWREAQHAQLERERQKRKRQEQLEIVLQVQRTRQEREHLKQEERLRLEQELVAIINGEERDRETRLLPYRKAF